MPKINLLPAPKINFIESSHLLTVKCDTVEIGPGVSLSGVITVSHGTRIVFKGWSFINHETEFRFEYPRGPVNWEGHPYR